MTNVQNLIVHAVPENTAEVQEPYTNVFEAVELQNLQAILLETTGSSTASHRDEVAVQIMKIASAGTREPNAIKAAILALSGNKTAG